MRRRICLLSIFLTSLTLAAFAQTDKWTGTWQCSVKQYATASPITMQLQIGVPEQGVLYPAKIKLQYGRFTGVYELLLARKNEQQLGIGKGKYPLQETPFKLGIWLWYLNGTLDFKNDKISVNRMWIDQFGIWMQGLYADDEIWVQTKVMLRDFLYRDSITLKKVNNKPLADSSVRRILHSDLYFGKYDQIVANDSAVLMQVEDQEKYDEDTVTLVQNTRPIFSKEQINDKNRRQTIALDTGRNLFAFFADNYGGLPPNTGNLYMKIDGKEYSFDFRDRPNAYATFLVADLYHPVQPAKSRLTTIAEQRTTTPVATIKVDTSNIVLELWDERVEDGDSISLSLNGKWIATGFPVRNNIQKIPVKLQKGENVLLFMADNLGRIPPNTSVLRIRFGRNSKRLGINTDLHKNSEIRIMVE
ncbi:hypothetical protein SAMN04488505_103444 [Chitinophaga rupis]|uniref:Uncharacterized protein n=1 Tax=Chitinophaga rupis TaxID=573321 RepID=A0A1H7VTS6_9BACT|nr:hypothetical protein [Chitinophaga rupis]SEM12673.1 hypothetical protein SAMN04488505_103444 [Chitinophaga rupis]